MDLSFESGKTKPRPDWKPEAERLQAVTTMTVGWIAERLAMGTRGYLNHLLYRPEEAGRRVNNIKNCPPLHSSLVHECPGDLCTQCAEGLQSNGREPLPARIRTIMAQYPRKRLRVLHAEVERELLWGGIGRVSQAFYHLAEDGTF